MRAELATAAFPVLLFLLKGTATGRALSISGRSSRQHSIHAGNTARNCALLGRKSINLLYIAVFLIVCTSPGPLDQPFWYSGLWNSLGKGNEYEP